MSTPILNLSRILLTWVLLATASSSLAEKTLTIASPSGQKEITLDEDPEVIISYTPTGMKLDFTNINMKVVCIEDPSANGLCRLQAYDGASGGDGSGGGVPASPAKPGATAGDGQVALSWTAPDDNGSAIVGYRIDQTSPSNTTIVSNTNSTATSYTVSGLANGTSYRFAVAAINGSGLGYMSPSSDAVTPVSSGGNPDSGAYETACNKVPSIVSCQKYFAGDLETGGSERSVSIPDNKVLSIPFILESGTIPVAIEFQSFQSADRYFFEAWLSAAANGTELSGGNCRLSQPQAESIISVKSQSGKGTGCALPSGEGLVWLNFRFWNPYTDDYAGYIITTLTVSPNFN